MQAALSAPLIAARSEYGTDRPGQVMLLPLKQTAQRSGKAPSPGVGITIVVTIGSHRSMAKFAKDPAGQARVLKDLQAAAPDAKVNIFGVEDEDAAVAAHCWVIYPNNDKISSRKLAALSTRLLTDSHSIFDPVKYKYAHIEHVSFPWVSSGLANGDSPAFPPKTEEAFMFTAVLHETPPIDFTKAMRSNFIKDLKRYYPGITKVDVNLHSDDGDWDGREKQAINFKVTAPAKVLKEIETRVAFGNIYPIWPKGKWGKVHIEGGSRTYNVWKSDKDLAPEIPENKRKPKAIVTSGTVNNKCIAVSALKPADCGTTASWTVTVTASRCPPAKKCPQVIKRYTQYDGDLPSESICGLVAGASYDVEYKYQSSTPECPVSIKFSSRFKIPKPTPAPTPPQDSSPPPNKKNGGSGPPPKKNRNSEEAYIEKADPIGPTSVELEDACPVKGGPWTSITWTLVPDGWEGPTVTDTSTGSPHGIGGLTPGKKYKAKCTCENGEREELESVNEIKFKLPLNSEDPEDPCAGKGCGDACKVTNGTTLFCTPNPNNKAKLVCSNRSVEKFCPDTPAPPNKKNGDSGPPPKKPSKEVGNGGPPPSKKKDSSSPPSKKKDGSSPPSKKKGGSSPPDGSTAEGDLVCEEVPEVCCEVDPSICCFEVTESCDPNDTKACKSKGRRSLFGKSPSGPMPPSGPPPPGPNSTSGPPPAGPKPPSRPPPAGPKPPSRPPPAGPSGGTSKAPKLFDELAKQGKTDKCAKTMDTTTCDEKSFSPSIQIIVSTDKYDKFKWQEDRNQHHQYTQDLFRFIRNMNIYGANFDNSSTNRAPGFCYKAIDYSSNALIEAGKESVGIKIHAVDNSAWGAGLHTRIWFKSVQQCVDFIKAFNPCEMHTHSSKMTDYRNLKVDGSTPLYGNNDPKVTMKDCKAGQCTEPTFAEGTFAAKLAYCPRGGTRNEKAGSLDRFLQEVVFEDPLGKKYGRLHHRMNMRNCKRWKTPPTCANQAPAGAAPIPVSKTVPLYANGAAVEGKHSIQKFKHCKVEPGKTEPIVPAVSNSGPVPSRRLLSKKSKKSKKSKSKKSGKPNAKKNPKRDNPYFRPEQLTREEGGKLK